MGINSLNFGYANTVTASRIYELSNQNKNQKDSDVKSYIGCVSHVREKQYNT